MIYVKRCIQTVKRYSKPAQTVKRCKCVLSYVFTIYALNVANYIFIYLMYIEMYGINIIDYV